MSLRFLEGSTTRRVYVGFLTNLVSKFLGSDVATQSESLPPTSVSSASGLTMTVSSPDKSQPSVVISDAEVAEVIARYAFVLTNELAMLNPADRWFDEATQKRRLRDDSEKKYEWLVPFLPLELAKLDQLKPFLVRGPIASVEIAKVFRALIRERRKVKQPYDDLLRALYGACILNHFEESLVFEGTVAYAMTGYVGIQELQEIRIEYSSMGYEHIRTLSKTDVKWLVEIFGEPVKHQSFNGEYSYLRTNAISRRCWEQLKKENETARLLGCNQKTMNEWLSELVKTNLITTKEFLLRITERQTKRAEQVTDIETAIAATKVPFVVADLETTGLMVESSEVLDLAAESC